MQAEVAEGVHRLTQGVTNFYLIEESGKFTLVDAGAPGDWDFCRSFGTLGQLTDLDAVLLTHGRPGPQIMPSGLNEDSAEALRSLDVMRDLPADVLLPGHGDPWTQGAAEAVSRAKAAGRS